MSSRSLEFQLDAISEFLIATEALSDQVDLLASAADDLDLAQKIERVANRSLSALRRETQLKAIPLHLSLLELANNPKLKDPRVTVVGLSESLEEAAEQVDCVSAVVHRLEWLEDAIGPIELLGRLHHLLASAGKSLDAISRGLSGLREAEEAPIPKADLLFSSQGARQDHFDSVLWLQMRIASEEPQLLTLFALNAKGIVLNSARRRGSWARWDLLEFRFAGVSLDEIAAMRMQFS